MPIDQGLAVCNALFTQDGAQTANIPVDLHPLRHTVHLRIQTRNTVYMDQTGCGVSYEGFTIDATSVPPTLNFTHEIEVWHIGILFLEYVFGLFSQKATEGQCHNHPKPCPQGREFHRDIVTRLKEDLKLLLAEVEQLETTLANPEN